MLDRQKLERIHKHNGESNQIHNLKERAGFLEWELALEIEREHSDLVTECESNQDIVVCMTTKMTLK